MLLVLRFSSWQPRAPRDAHFGKMPWQPGEANARQPIVTGPYEYLSGDEATFLDAAVARVIPNDELGPGAKEAGVTTFIDRQLAGPYGNSSETARDNKGAQEPSGLRGPRTLKAAVGRCRPFRMNSPAGSVANIA